MTTIQRSGGVHIGFGLVAGGGSFGITAELDQVVAEAATALAAAYSTEVVIRFSSDRESGGAFLVTPDGDNAGVGITASLVTARARRQWETSAAESEAEARTGQASWGEQMSARQREGARKVAAYWRGMLARHPEGELTICAHIRSTAAAAALLGELIELPGWNDETHGCRDGRGYHHGPADSVADALGRCRRYAPGAAS